MSSRGGEVQGLAIADNYAYLAATNELRIVDVSDSSAPHLISSIATVGPVTGVAISSHYAYVTVYGKGMQVFDISDATSPTPVGTWDSSAPAISVEISGSYAYIAAGADGLDIIDISDPTKPTLAGAVDTPGLANHVAISGHFIFIADDPGGLQIADAFNPQAPTIVGHYARNTGSNAITGIALSGTDVVLTDANGILAIVDVADPTAPTLRAQLGLLPGPSWAVAVSGTVAYVAGGTQLTTFDISDPTHPHGTTTLDLGNDTLAVEARSGLAYVAAGSGIQIVDMPHPYFPVLAGAVGCGVGYARAIELAGNQATVFDPFGGHSYDISDQTNPVFVSSTQGQTQSPGTPQRQVTIDGYTYTATGMILQVSDAAHPDLAYIAVPVPSGEFDYMGYQTQAIAVSGTYAYLVAGRAGLLVIDISDPSKPTIAAQYRTLGCYYTDVSLSGQFAYVAAGTEGLELFRLHHSPQQITISPSSVDENSPAGTFVGTLTATDPEPGVTITYSLVGGQTNLFQLDGDKLTLTAPVDYETYYGGHLYVAVRATDSNGLWIEQEQVITVNYVDEPPTDISLSNATVPENFSGVSVGFFSATDPNPRENFAYALVDGPGADDNSQFALYSSGSLYASGSTNLDYEQRSSYTIRVRVTDGGGLTFEKAFAITVTDRPEPLFIAGTAGNDVITVTDLGGNLLRYTVNGVGHQFLTSSLTIGAQGGDDLVTVDPSVTVSCTIYGRAGNDTLLGGSGTDFIYGAGGNDRIRGGSGDDVIDGGAGDDRLFGGAGNDQIAGRAGNDMLDGGDGNDDMYGGDGDDLMYGRAGNDSLRGAAGADTIYGGAGGDSIDGGVGEDWMSGGAGNDSIDAYDNSSDTVLGGPGTDAASRGSSNTDLITGVETIY